MKAEIGMRNAEKPETTDEAHRHRWMGASFSLPPSAFRSPPSPAARPRAAAGFTLLEILVAIFILALVVTTVLASFNMVFSTSETLEGTAAVFDMGRTCMSRIIRDLDNIFVLERPLYQAPGISDSPDPYRFQGTLDTLAGERFARLRFTSRAHVPIDRSNRDGIAEIVYYVQSDPSGGLRLKRADHLYPYPRFEERTTDPVLCENLKALTIEYVDAEGVVADTWDSDSTKFGNATPVIVAVRLEIARGNDSYAFHASIGLPMGRAKSG